MSLTEL